jgi:hypothetical protein
MLPSDFESTPLALKLFGRTFIHPVVGPLVEWVPTAWLLELANPHPSATTDLGNWGSDERVDWSALFANIAEQGMRDPFLIGVGRVTRTIRLEAGNQRVRCMAENGIPYLPAVAYVGDSAITHLGNGPHEGRIEQLRLPADYPNIMGPYPVKEYRKLSEVLTCFPTE